MAKVFLQLFLLNAILLVQLKANFNSFNQKLYGVIARDNPNSNVFISPFSINIALGLLYLGAENQSAKKLRDALQLKKSSKLEVAKDYGDLITGIITRNNNVKTKLKIANRVFVRLNLPLAPIFQELSTKYFKSHPENLQFRDSELAVKRINSWVEQQTANKIHDLLKPGDVNGDTQLVLVNAIYFKGDWVYKFQNSKTNKGTFHLNDNKEISVDFMRNMDDDFNYGEFVDLDAKVLEMPYASSNLSMIIILPNEINGLAKLEKNIETINLKKIIANLKRTSIDLMIPKFRLDVEVDLEEPLKKIGIDGLFSSDADLSGFVVSPKKLELSVARHKAFIQVDEEGSEAAAATDLTFVDWSAPFEPKHKFHANRPFLFTITNKKQSLFAGHVVRP